MGGGRIVSSLPSSYDLVFGFHAEEACGQLRAASYWSCGDLRGVCAITASLRVEAVWCGGGLGSMDVDCMDAGACTYVSKQECR